MANLRFVLVLEARPEAAATVEARLQGLTRIAARYCGMEVISLARQGDSRGNGRPTLREHERQRRGAR
jgi:hypothetical protein